MEWIEQIWPDLVKIVALVIAIVTSIGGLNRIIDLMKGWLNVDGAQAKILSWVLRGLMGVLVAIVAGTISPESFTSWVDLFVLIVTIFMGSEGLYKFRKYRV